MEPTKDQLLKKLEEMGNEGPTTKTQRVQSPIVYATEPGPVVAAPKPNFFQKHVQGTPPSPGCTKCGGSSTGQVLGILGFVFLVMLAGHGFFTLLKALF